jgi:hypothetical protein
MAMSLFRGDAKHRTRNLEIPGSRYGAPRNDGVGCDWPAKPKQRSCEGWRPGLDLNQDKELCTALASTLSATGPVRSSPITPR